MLVEPDSFRILLIRKVFQPHKWDADIIRMPSVRFLAIRGKKLPHAREHYSSLLLTGNQSDSLWYRKDPRVMKML